MSKTRTIVFCFGRMQPITAGHEHIVQKVVTEARSHKADHVVFLSQTQDSDKNPLDWNFKRRMFEAAFPGIRVSSDETIKTPYQALEHLSEQYDKVIFVCGEDRIDAFSSMPEYSQKKGAECILESAGKRDSTAQGIAGMSASKARQAAKNNDFKQFLSLMPGKMSNDTAKQMYDQIVAQNGLEEESTATDMNKEADEYRQGSLRGEFVFMGWG